MSGSRFAALALACFVFGVPAGAQTLRSIDGPAERPPASYTGKQYVDSRGCVFVRAGYGGTVTWVPRVSRSGKVLCSARPTRVAGAEPANPKTAVGEPPKAGLSAPLVPTTRSAPKKVVKTRTTQTVVPAAAPRVVQAPVAPAAVPAPRRVVAQRPAAPALVQTGRPACDYGGAASRYVNSGAKYPVRCGPQAEHPGGNPIVGGHVVNRRDSQVLAVAGPRPVTMPQGYVPVWDDGRLNPRRGVGTLQGAVETRLVWTNTVPRRLINPYTGQDVTLKYAYLVYPYTDYAQQKAALGRDAAVQTVTVSSISQPQAGRAASTPATTGTYKSTRTAPTSAGERQSAGNTSVKSSGGKPDYIRIGIFLDAAQKDRAVARLRGMGVPVKVGAVRHKGAPATMVVVGPYAAGRDLNPILRRLKSSGFPAARVR